MPTSVSVLLGVGDGSFPMHVEYEAGLDVVDLAAADFNNDGYVDLVSGGVGTTGAGIFSCFPARGSLPITD